jgi:hypothetical protein
VCGMRQSLVTSLVVGWISIVLVSAQYGEDCAPGSYVFHGVYCRWCEAGTYQTEINAGECIECRKGTVSGLIGASSPHVCQNCPSGTYAVSLKECRECPPHMTSPSGAESEAECTVVAGYYYSAAVGGEALECPANFYCVQGTEAPTPCPEGTGAVPGSSQCTAGMGPVLLFDWILGASWLILLFSGVFGLGLYRMSVLKSVQPSHSSTSQIQIQITRP